MRRFQCRFGFILITILSILSGLYILYLSLGFNFFTKEFVTSQYVISQENKPEEKRGTPSYDYVIGKDNLPHFRVFFWVPKSAKNYSPYADAGIKTGVLGHAPIEKWGVSETKICRDDEKLVFIYVPKRFVLFYGTGFDKLIHLHYRVSQNK